MDHSTWTTSDPHFTTTVLYFIICYIFMNNASI
ncbi:hypothetical protein HmCmsJML218_00323 [Escherichia coli]|nr:hypothetical protein HmCmsJML218_00323 [Escherichia coli]